MCQGHSTLCAKHVPSDLVEEVEAGLSTSMAVRQGGRLDFSWIWGRADCTGTSRCAHPSLYNCATKNKHDHQNPVLHMKMQQCAPAQLGMLRRRGLSTGHLNLQCSPMNVRNMLQIHGSMVETQDSASQLNSLLVR